MQISFCFYEALAITSVVATLDLALKLGFGNPLASRFECETPSALYGMECISER